MYDKFQHKTSPSLIVEALFYKEDASNQSEVVTFLSARAKAREIAADGTTVVARTTLFRANDTRVHPGTMVAIYPDGIVSPMDRMSFDLRFHPLPTGEHYIAKTDEFLEGALLVQAYYYLPDRSNEAAVQTFLGKHFDGVKAVKTERHDGTKVKLPCLAVPYQKGSTMYMYPGRVAVVYGENPAQVTTLNLARFLDLYMPVTVTPLDIPPAPLEESPKPVYPDIRTYRRLSDSKMMPDIVHAMRYQPERNFTALRDLLCPYGSVFGTNNLGALFRPEEQYIEIASLSKDSFNKPLTIDPRCWVTITQRGGDQLPRLCMYSDNLFHETFIAYDPPKANTVPKNDEPLQLATYSRPDETGPETEYQTNRNKVYDALAVLRTPNNDDKVEIVTTELMDLLSIAFNDGFSLGLETGQTNPYVDWK
jgi:hypothetical protein